jgi:hypothetical protein
MRNKIQTALDEGYSPNEVLDFLAAERGFSAQVTAARDEGYDDGEILDFLATSPSAGRQRSRTWGEAIKDPVALFGEGSGSAVKATGEAVRALVNDDGKPLSLGMIPVKFAERALKNAVGDFKPESSGGALGFSPADLDQFTGRERKGVIESAQDALHGAADSLRETGETTEKFWADQKSDYRKGVEAASQERIQRAEEEGGQWGGAKAGLVEVAKDLEGFAKQLPQLAVLAVTSRLGGVGGGIAGGAVLQGGDVASETREALDALELDEFKANSSRFNELVEQGLPEKEARAQVTDGLVRDAFGLSSVLSGAVNALTPGGAALERLFAGKALLGASPKQVALSILKAGAGEGVTEAIEEGGGKRISNAVVQQVNPEQESWAGVGAASGQGLGMGVLMGGGTHTVAGAQHLLEARNIDATTGMEFSEEGIDAAAIQAAVADDARMTLRMQADEAQSRIAGAGSVDDAINAFADAANATSQDLLAGNNAASAESMRQAAARVHADAAVAGGDVLTDAQMDEQILAMERGAAESDPELAALEEEARALDVPALAQGIEIQQRETGTLELRGDKVKELLQAIVPDAPAVTRADGSTLLSARFAGPVIEAVAAAQQQAPSYAQLRQMSGLPEVELVQPTAIPEAAPVAEAVANAADAKTASWVIRNKETGEPIFETFDRKKVDALNTAKYEAVPIRKYLEELNQQISGEPAAEAQATQEPMLRSNGQPFKTEASAVLSARQRGLTGAQAVEVEGGWGLALPDGAAQRPAQKRAPKTELTPEEMAANAWSAMTTIERNAAAVDVLGAGFKEAKAIAAAGWADLDQAQRDGLIESVNARHGQRWTDPNRKATDQRGPVLQPRDRTEAASTRQMLAIANNPDYDKVSYSRTFMDGAPVTIDEIADLPEAQRGRKERASTAGSRKIPVQYAVLEAEQLLSSNTIDGAPVEAYAAGEAGKSRAIAGNGRVAGLTEAWVRGNAEQYRQAMMEDSDAHGIDPGVIAGMKHPILVRLMPTSEVTSNIGDLSNRDEKLGKTTVERAKEDGRSVDLSALKFNDEGGITLDTVTSFIHQLPQNENLTIGGKVSKEASERLEAAIFHKAYGHDELTAMQAEKSDESRSIITAMTIAAPHMAKLEGAGLYDIRSLVSEAAVAAINASRKGVRLADYVKQVEMGANPEIYPILEMMLHTNGRIRSGKYIAEQLIKAAKLAYSEASAPSMDMFGEKPKRTVRQIFGEAFSEVEGDGQIQAGDSRDGGSAEGVGQRGRPEPDAEAAERGETERGRPEDGRGAEGSRAAGEEAPGELTLDSYTNDEILQREETQRAAEEREAKRRQEEDRRAQADAELDNFTLTGSNRPADLLAAQGQVDMFGNSPTPEFDDDAPSASDGGPQLKFSRAGVESAITLTGQELGEFGDDTKALRKTAIAWYQDNLQGRPATHPTLGEVRFTKKGRDEVKSFSADPDKLKLVPALREIIERGEHVRTEPIDHPRADGVVAFHIIEADIALAGAPLRVMVDVGVDENGNLFYDLFKDAAAHEERKNARRSNLEPKSRPSAGAGGVSASLAPILDDGELNIKILDRDGARGESRPATMTRDDIRQAAIDALPGMGRVVDEVLRRGEEGKAGGVVVVEDAGQLAETFADKTGRSLKAARSILQASIRAWHGTPYRGIEKTGFKLNKIGTGEGAQAYGHGIYFASSRGVAEAYQKEVKDSGRILRLNAEMSRLAKIMAADAVPGGYRQYRTDEGRRAAQEYDRMMDERISVASDQGQLYRQDLPVEESDLLDWDAPLDDQPEKVRDALKATDWYAYAEESAEIRAASRGENASGQGIYQWLTEDYTPQEASELLQAAGIPGLRYLDGNSRNAGEGSHNYVIWDESLLTPEAAQIEPMYSKNGDVQGFHDPQSGLTFLVAPNLTAQTAPAVLLHEATHARQRDGIDQRALALIEGRAKAMKPVRTFLDGVAARMEEAGETGNAEEATAYIVEEAVLQGRQAGFSAADGKLLSWIDRKLGKRVGNIVRDFVAMIRAWGLKRGMRVDPTVDDLVALAKSNLREMAAGKVEATGGRTAASMGDAEVRGLVEQYANEGGAPTEAEIRSAVREYRETERAYGGKEAWQRAKDAGKTKLNYHQWVQVRTPNFKRWLGDWGNDPASASKVTDPATGEPQVVYHGTNAEFNAFEPSQTGALGAGIYLSGFNGEAGQYGDRVIDAYASIKNPVTGTFAEVRAMQRQNESAQQWTARMIEDGHDGIITRTDAGDLDYVVAFRPEQIKSATGNIGTFSEGSNDIRFSRSGRSAPAAVYSSPKMPEGFVAKKIDWVTYQLQDKYKDLKAIQQSISDAGHVIRDQFNPYQAETLMHGKSAYRVSQFLEGEIDPVLTLMRKAQISIDDLNEYIHARHAKERNAEMAKRNPNEDELDALIDEAAAELEQAEQAADAAPDDGALAAEVTRAASRLRALQNTAPWSGTEEDRQRLSGLSNEAADKVLAKAHGGMKATAYRKLGDMVDALIMQTRAEQVAYGLESPEAMAAMASAYQHYVPLKRDIDESELLGSTSGTGAGLSIRGSMIKQATGSLRDVENILANIVMAREATIVRGEKNRVAKAMYGMMLENPNSELYSVIRPNTSAKALRRQLANMGLDEDTIDNMVGAPSKPVIDPKTGLVKRQVNPYSTLDNAIVLRVAGEDRVILFNRQSDTAVRLVKALRNDDTDFSSGAAKGLMQTLGPVTRYISAINTQYNLVFGLKNFTRDVQEAMLNMSATEMAGSQKAFMKNVPLALAAIRSDVRGDGSNKHRDLYHQFLADGGATGYRDLYANLENRVKAIQRDLEGSGIRNAKGIKQTLDFISDYNTVIENGVRFAAYKTAIEAGLSRARAAELAKDLTVNFNRKGARSGFFSSLYAFFNAAVQGTNRLARTLKSPAGKKIIAGGVALGALQTVLGILAFGDDWDEIPEFERAQNLILPVPFGLLGEKKYLKIPMALGFSAIPNIGRSMVEMAYFRDRLGDRSLGLVLSVLNAVNPLGSDSLVDMWAPSAAKPLIQAGMNRNAFDRAIEQREFSDLAPTPGWSRGKEDTSAIFKGLAYAINWVTSGGDEYEKGLVSPTPEMLSFITGNITGGVGRELTKAVTFAERLVLGEDIPSYSVPVLGMFYGHAAGESMLRAKYYAALKEINAAEFAAKRRIEAGEDLGKYAGRAGLASAGRRIQNAISVLRKIKQDTSDRKEREELNAAILDLQSRLVEMYDENEKREP